MIKKVITIAALALATGTGFAQDEKTVDEAVLKKAIEDGKASYVTCQACHQATGAGLAPVFPPLAKSDWVNKLDNEALIKIVLLGMQGESTVNGVKYGATPMAPLGALLDDQKVADVLTYVKNSFENEGGYVSAEEVKVVREATKGKPMLDAKELQALVDAPAEEKK